MYEWRKMTPKERRETLDWRKAVEHPWHSPPHPDLGERHYLLTAACYEHAPIIGKSDKRLAGCEKELLEALAPLAKEICAWCVLPNHYHVLVFTDKVREVGKTLGKFHGRMSYAWNGEDGCRGRTVWRNHTHRAIRSERHFWASMNYVHHNAVKHGCVEEWTDWAYSSARAFLDAIGREEATRIWTEHPLLGYGKGWDD